MFPILGKLALASIPPMAFARCGSRSPPVCSSSPAPGPSERIAPEDAGPSALRASGGLPNQILFIIRAFSEPAIHDHLTVMIPFSHSPRRCYGTRAFTGARSWPSPSPRRRLPFLRPRGPAPRGHLRATSASRAGFCTRLPRAFPPGAGAVSCLHVQRRPSSYGASIVSWIPRSSVDLRGSPCGPGCTSPA